MAKRYIGRRYLLAILTSLALAATAAANVTRGLSPEPQRAVDPATAGTQLRAAAERYRQLAGNWQPPVAGAALRPGDRGERVAGLRAVLQLLGDYRGQPGPVTAAGGSGHFDAGLQRAVESYQRRHGLEVTGIAGQRTLAELSIPPEERARRLELNADRWDKLKVPEDGRYVLINVPDFRLQLVERGRVILNMKTVVGKTSSRTPSMRSRVTNVVFNPSWTVPRSILLTELLPKARNNPQAMHNRGYRVVNYRSGDTSPISPSSISRAAHGSATLRQVSGPDNTLGRVKFVIPNNQSIFLHDTQAQSLFDIRERAFSHGCIRLERPEELAYALLSQQGWDRTRVARATVGDESVNIRVDKPPRLYIAYLTAWVDDRGQAQFRPDIYHLDRENKQRE